MSLREIHERIEKAKDLAKFLEYLELTEIPKCAFYHWDNGACEEYCYLPTKSAKRQTDFDSKVECWQCSDRKVRKEM